MCATLERADFYFVGDDVLAAVWCDASFHLVEKFVSEVELCDGVCIQFHKGLAVCVAYVLPERRYGFIEGQAFLAVEDLAQLVPDGFQGFLGAVVKVEVNADLV